ncbi:MAG TPA: amidohydrolase family protein, partial [Phnomibacter sp.]|nr:amidohydrolase family protein [Phnomibacter sp.]
MQKILTLVLMLLLQRAGLSQTWYLQQVAVIDVEQGKVTPGQTLVIANGQIATIQPDAKIKIPNGATLVNAAGKYVMPGLIDAHIHFFQSGGLYTRPDVVDFRWKVPYEKELSFGKENAIDYLKRYLRLGITTVADIGGPFFNFKIRDSIAKTTSPLPNVLVTGPLFSMIENDYFGADKPIEHIETIEAANRLMDSMLPYKPDFIKVWYIAAPENPVHKNYELVKHIASRSKAAGLKLLVHATELETAKLAVAAGAQVLVHSVSDTLLPFDFIASLNAKGVVVIPTLTVSTNYVKALSGMAKPHAQDLTFANAFAYGTLQHLEHIPQVLQPPLIAILRKGAMAASFKKSDSIQAVNLMRLLNAGITIATGTDAGNIGTHHASSYIQELEAMEAAGMSAAQLVKASTLGGAVALGRQPTCGTVAAGKVADLLLLD